MNLLKKFVRNDNADLENDAYNDVYDIYTMPKELEAEMESADAAANVSSIDNPARKEPEIRPASPDKVALKLLQPKSHTEAVKIADKLKEGCIVLLDISNLTKDGLRERYGDRIASRIMDENITRSIEFKGNSLRYFGEDDR